MVLRWSTMIDRNRQKLMFYAQLFAKIISVIIIIIVANNLKLLSPVGIQISWHRLTCYIIMQYIIYYICIVNKTRLLPLQSRKNNDFSCVLRY